jgi:hypothetical protein
VKNWFQAFAFNCNLHRYAAAKMLSAPAEESAGALVDRLAGVMAVNALSAVGLVAFASVHVPWLASAGFHNP